MLNDTFVQKLHLIPLFQCFHCKVQQLYIYIYIRLDLTILELLLSIFVICLNFTVLPHFQAISLLSAVYAFSQRKYAGSRQLNVVCEFANNKFSFIFSCLELKQGCKNIFFFLLEMETYRLTKPNL